jgi:small subunit ribosomal protein S20
MPHTEHRKKTLEKSRKAREINRARRSTVRTALKKARTAVDEGKATPETMQTAVKSIDKAAEYGVFHPNKASRLKSRCDRRIPPHARADELIP